MPKQILVTLTDQQEAALAPFTGRGRDSQRAAIISRGIDLAIVEKTSHRASFELEDNDFANEQNDGRVYLTAPEVAIPFCDLSAEMAEKFIQHTRTGYHPDCVICRERDDRTASNFGDGRRDFGK